MYKLRISMSQDVSEDVFPDLQVTFGPLLLQLLNSMQCTTSTKWDYSTCILGQHFQDWLYPRKGLLWGCWSSCDCEVKAGRWTWKTPQTGNIHHMPWQKCTHQTHINAV